MFLDIMASDASICCCLVDPCPEYFAADCVVRKDFSHALLREGHTTGCSFGFAGGVGSWSITSDLETGIYGRIS